MHRWLQAAEIVQCAPLLFLQHNVLITDIRNLLRNLWFLSKNINNEQYRDNYAQY
jgi:hypothetical protein